MFGLPLLPLAEVNMMWYAVPLIIVISLVYAATHHERMRPILEHATRLALMISGFMLAIMVVLAIISWQL
jgi:hypothetical protein